MCNRYLPSRAQLTLFPEDPRFVAPYWAPDPVPEAPAVGIGPRQMGWFIRPHKQDQRLEEVHGIWGLIADHWTSPEPPVIPSKQLSKVTGKPLAGKPMMTNNTRDDRVKTAVTFKGPWGRGQRCIIPAAWWTEPNHETGRNVWWNIRLAGPYATGLAGIYNSWIDKNTGEVFESYSMMTVNCDDHPLLRRMHRPDRTRPVERQDKRAVVPLHPERYAAWLYGSEEEAWACLTLPPEAELEAGPIGQVGPDYASPQDKPAHNALL